MAENDIKTKLDIAIANLTEIIDTTHCGYCKAIIGDARNILTGYEGLMDKAEELDRIQREQNTFLSETSQKADEIIQSKMSQSAYSPEQTRQVTMPGGPLMSRLQTRRPISMIQSQVKNRGGIIKNIFGDMSPFEYLIGDNTQGR